LERFKNHPLRDEMVALRLWDDAAKIPNIETITPRAREYLDLVVEHLEGEGSGSL
jgi:predicted HD phosphohydrolase